MLISTRTTLYAAFVGSVCSSYLPSINDASYRLHPRSHELEVSSLVESYMDDIAENITMLFKSHEPKHLEFRSDVTRTRIPQPAIVQRAPDPPTATTVKVDNDPAPDGTEWDESIANDDDARAQVKTAWNEALRLVKLANGGLDSLQKSLDGANLGNDLDKKKDHVARESPAFAQQFGSDPDIIGNVKSVFQDIINKIGDVNAAGRGDQVGKVLRLGLGGKVKSDRASGSKNICGTKKDKDTTVYAATYIGLEPKDNNQPLQKKYKIEDTIIFFCDGFFTHLGDPNQLESDADAMKDKVKLDKMRTPGQTVVHEMTHVAWIKHTNENTDEVYGYEETATLMRDQGKNLALDNADSYAVFASYHAYNQQDWAPNNKLGCKDVWPRDGDNNDVFKPAKPGKETWP